MTKFNVLVRKGFIAATLLATLIGGGAAYASEAPNQVIGAKTVEVVDKAYLGKAVKVWGWRDNNGFSEKYVAGTGFFLEGGYVITAEHVVATLYDPAYGYDKFVITDGTVGSTVHEVEIIATDKHLDLALLKTSLVDHPYFELADHVSVGQAMFHIGNSEDRASVFKEFNEMQGNIIELARMTTIQNEGGPILSQAERMYSTSTSLPGDSGGPALNKDKEVIGVVIARVLTNNNAIIVRLQDLRKFVDANLPKEATK